MILKQYDIYEFDLRTCISDEELPQKVIQGAILSPDVMNEVLRTVVFAPICSSCTSMPTTFKIDEFNLIRLDQISTVNKKRATKKVGSVDKSQIPKIKQVLKEMLVE